jgi:hypothetical protein
MFPAGRLGHQNQSGHPRLEHHGVARVQLHDNALADAANLRDDASHCSSAKAIDPRRDLYRPATTGHALDILDPGTNNAGNSSPHRFYFWQFRHGGATDVFLGLASEVMPNSPPQNRAPVTFGVAADANTLDSAAFTIENQRNAKN